MARNGLIIPLDIVHTFGQPRYCRRFIVENNLFAFQRHNTMARDKHGLVESMRSCILSRSN